MPPPNPPKDAGGGGTDVADAPKLWTFDGRPLECPDAPCITGVTILPSAPTYGWLGCGPVVDAAPGACVCGALSGELMLKFGTVVG